MKRFGKGLLAFVSLMMVVMIAGGIVVQADVMFTLPWRISNPDFEEVDFSGAANAGAPGIYYVHQNKVTGWSTASPTDLIEVWQDPNGKGVPAYSGQNFIELNAKDNYPIYQDIQTIPGTTLQWGFAHRGRDGVDEAGLLMGAPGNLQLIATADDGNDAWGYYTGTYVVPPGQTVTRLTFLAISTASGSITNGNFLDAVTLTIDVPGSQIGDYVWYDTNGDGVQQRDEPPAVGITVDLLNSNGNVVASTQTNDLGGYLFDDVAFGTYNIQVHLPLNGTYQYGFTKQLAGDDSTHNSHVDAAGMIYGVQSTLNGYYVDNDAGTITYSNAVIEKIDGDNQTPVAGAVFDITDNFGEVITQVTTDAQGKATIGSLATGTYHATEVAVADKYQLLTEPIDFTIGFESNESVIVTITNYLKRGSLEVVKVDDIDNNKLLAGAEFQVSDVSGDVIATAISNNSGLANFNNLLPGDYILVETKSPNGYQLNSKALNFTIPENPNGAVVITVENSKLVLPATGVNNDVFLSVGILISGGSLLALFLLRRR
ncbi:MSCRAMM family protein [Culicoidibacter larvae]|uniref:LPXTG cell wall anchor domain-containing protein n=1 Tax=Culicoidibacter larvae TaxID=2579976 RepID=A0A5R8Q926_9FIRM|nr:SpaA isopeptide-forming pilin-related protein [Culicoidibacter larvae]TLG71793.1 LPXTG cell wall anchor domain-containing protein [Culicoidibacter larvae]